ncbi:MULTISPECIES: branched-chain amino acid aminotransferase [Tatumella]|uniref:branched-chain-amino-acid transaminase n=1 Tax=Tatumella punctata TaxID=399969 RepID=A0ABW1VMJ1_9GAMM|nr:MULTISPECIES: branched-chain amino acid aminotransferase [unclassified Tatumella]MBS0855164.1 branched-chain amino acid aminotransferase [Tatumella sp. JGM16]MBS0892937.1 branched-chain amino acid aminotransferase [Tatumella sp. JGM130]MBS0911721.1 branched-chain amino acid aminotransferase [Tatumella sp. JGM91]
MNSREIIWFDGEWSTKDKPVIGLTDHALWMASGVFDGARSVKGHLPDLDAHCQRAIKSAITMGMAPKISAENIADLVREGLTQLPHDTDYYIKVLFFSPGGFLLPDPDSTTFALHIFETALPEDNGFSATFSPYRRPDASMAPTEAKASCLYPNTQRIIREANQRGFNTAVVLDAEGNIAEFAAANLWIVKQGTAYTPLPNGSFLNGITRQRVIKLLRAEGIPVEEVTLTTEDVLNADEIFSTGNHGKVLHCNRIEEKTLSCGPVSSLARRLYQDFTLQSEKVTG